MLNLKPTEKQAIQSISQCLFEAEVQLHILHLQAIAKSFEIHTAIGDLYDVLVDLNDDLVEKSYPKVGLLTAYKDIKVSNNINALPYVENLFAELEKYRTFVQTGYIQQMIDNILEKVAHTIYKLTNLQ